MKKIDCPNCGKTLSDNDKFCSGCGTKIEHMEEVVVENIPKRGRPKKIVDIEETIPHQEVVQEIPKNDNLHDQPIYPSYQQYSNIKVPKEKKNDFESKKKYVYPVIAVVVTFALCLFAFTCFYRYYLENLVIETTKTEVTVTDTGIADAVSKVYDSVVVVECYVKNQLYSTGTGFVYKTDDDKAYILTNNHVVSEGDEVKVVFTNNSREEVDIVGKDAYADIALLAIDKDKIISVAEIGSSENIKIGDTTFAVGAPIDSTVYAGTTTRGIVSGKNRMVEVSLDSSSSSTVFMEVLQTDTALNNGNSGGPLCNSNGEVIGITNMGLNKTVAEGISFAIPIETATKLADKFINGEKVTYPYVGVMIYNAQPTFRNPDASGVYVESVEKGSPAEKAGIKAGDKIISVGDGEVTSTSMFQFLLYKHEVGDKVEIVVERNGSEKVLEVVLGSNNPTM